MLHMDALPACIFGHLVPMETRRGHPWNRSFTGWVMMWVTRCWRSNLSPLSHLSSAPKRENSVTLSFTHVRAFTFAETHSCSVVSGGHKTQPGRAMCRHDVFIHRHLLITELPRAVQPCTQLLEHVQYPHTNDLLDVGHRRINLVQKLSC